MTLAARGGPPGGGEQGGGDRLRLALYCVTGPGGAHASLVTLLSALPRDIEVTVIGSPPDLVGQLAAARPGTVTRILPPVAGKFDVAAILRHIAAVHQVRPDILHVSCDNPWSSPYGLLAGVATRTPTIATVHGPAPSWRRRQEWLVRRLARHVDTYVSVSEASSRVAESSLNLRPGSVRTIHNGVPLPVERAPRPEPPGPVIGAVARFSPEKGLDVLVEAVARLGRGRLVLLGDGDERPQLESLVQRLGIVDRVHFAGWVAPPWTARWSFDVLVVPSRSEGFGLAAVESMLAGIPVVATAVGGLREVIENESTGLLVPADDAAAMAAAIDRVLGDPDLAGRLAGQAQLVASTRFSPEAMASAYEALYAEVADARGRSARRGVA
jgi:glycosyltransferase involved in cell wall biosynthesis